MDALVKLRFTMNIKMDSAKSYFRDGLFSHFDILPYEGGWIIQLYFRDTSLSVAHLIDARKGEKRVFNTLDSAVRTVKDIGFTFNGITSC